MKLKNLIGLGAAGAAAGTIGSAVYFFNTIMKRPKVSESARNRTMKMSGTDWEAYSPVFAEGREYMAQFEMENVSIESFDGLTLQGYFYPNGGSKKLMIMCHGFTGDAQTNFYGIAPYLLKRGYALLMVDARCHGNSEGDYVGFGVLDRLDLQIWIDEFVNRLGEKCKICLYGVSMGGATVLMSLGLELPSQVVGCIADCPFTSAKEVFESCLKTMYHLPATPILLPANEMVKALAGYSLDECNSVEEVKKATFPILLIHGEKDTFVPVSMTPKIAENANKGADVLIVPNAFHAESYYKGTKEYQEACDKYFKKVFKERSTSRKKKEEETTEEQQ